MAGKDVDECPLQSFDVHVDVADDGVLLVRGLEAFEVGSVGSVIWRHCDGKTSIKAIAEAVTAEFDVDEEVAQRDAVQLIGELRAAGLIE
jgi:hypothetical protein